MLGMGSLVLISSICIAIDLVTKFKSKLETIATDLVSCVIGNVELELASLGCRQSVLIQMLIQSDLMLCLDL